ncbi:integral membrane DUF6 protein [Rutstroemia sp. NJR-2017a WRK4]|nr:integral membrane DUF6 protein [Rutstroemia sp. NJR-2017a WRK4]
MSRHHASSSTSKFNFNLEMDGNETGDLYLHDIPSNFDIALNGSSNSSYLAPKIDNNNHPPLHSPIPSRNPSPFPPPPRSWIANFYTRYSGLLLVTLSQLFGALMNVTTRLLELEGDGMHPFQILFARMGLTMLCCCAWMWWKRVPDFPLGKKRVRDSLQYLPVADAVVITFLAPSVASYACYIFLHEPFPRSAQYASFISLLGVILIARPTSFFSPSSSSPSPSPPSNSTTTSSPEPYDFPTPSTPQRLSAIFFALLGVLGSAGAYTSIRLIGSDAHPMISVNYFAFVCTLVSLGSLVVSGWVDWVETVEFRLPTGGRQWGFLIALGVAGFVMQVLLTMGLSGSGGGREGEDGRGNGKKEKKKPGKEMNMVYLNMLFAMGLDKLVFGITPGVWSLMGSGLILGSAVWVAVEKGEEGEGDGNRNRGRGAGDMELSEEVGDEEERVGMLRGGEGRDGDGVVTGVEGLEMRMREGGR